nr:DUF5753 domain-containing protein [Streptomyces sp. LP05-1]
MDRALGTGTKFQQMSKGVRYATLIEGLPGFLEREAKAAEIRLYEVGVIPGLLQIREYALELAESAVRRKTITPEQAEERIRLVEQRQASLERTPPPLISAVLDESCLRRPVGSPAVMRKQYDRLLEFAALPNTVLQVAPFGMGADRPFDLPVTLLTMPDRSLASYAESAHRGHLERDSDFIVPLLTDYHQLQANALSQSESVALIKELRKGTT